MAAIDAPVVLADPVIPATEKAAPAEREERASVEEISDAATNKPVVLAAEEITPAPATEPVEKITETVVQDLKSPDLQPADAEPTLVDTPLVKETQPMPAETPFFSRVELAPLEIPKAIQTNRQPTDMPKIANSDIAETDRPEIAEAAPKQIEEQLTVSENASSIPAKEMQEILSVTPAAGAPANPETKIQPDTLVVDTRPTPVLEDTQNNSPSISAAEDPVTTVQDETINIVEAADPAATTVADEDADIVIADIATPTTMLDAQEPAPVPNQHDLPETTAETVTASTSEATKQLDPDVKRIIVNIPAWIEEAPTLPAWGKVEMALVLPPSQPSYTVVEPEVKDVKSADPEQEKASPSVEPVALTLPPADKPLWQTNAQPFEDTENRPRIAIIISEMGISKAGTTAAIDQLPAAVTLAFNPYGQRLQSWIDKSREKGHEVLLQLPMEPMGYPRTDPGPHALLTSLTSAENFEQLNWSLDRFSGYTGLTNQMGSKFTASRPHIEPILAVLKEKGLLYVDSRTASNSVAAKIAKELSIPVALNNRFLDHRADAKTLDARLTELENIALKTGSAIGIGYPYPATLKRLAAWTASLAEKGIALAPISALVNRQEIK